MPAAPAQPARHRLITTLAGSCEYSETIAPEGMIPSRPERWSATVALAWCAAGSMLLSLVAFLHHDQLLDPINGQDEGILLVYPEQILRGARPHVDFAASYPVGNAYVLAGVYQVFGIDLEVERLVGFAYHAFVGLGAFALGRRLSTATGVLCAATAVFACRLLASFATPILPAVAFALIAVACTWRALCAPRDATMPFVVAGLSSGVVLLFRQDVGLAAVASVAAITAIGAATRLPALAIGIALGLSPYAFIGSSAGLARLWDNLVMDPARIASGRFLPLRIGGTLVLLLTCAALSWAIAIEMLFRRRDRRRSAVLVGASVLSAGLLPSALQRADGAHLAYVGSVVIPLAVVALALRVTVRCEAERASPVRVRERIEKVLRLSTSKLPGVATENAPMRAFAAAALLFLSLGYVASTLARTYSEMEAMQSERSLPGRRWVPLPPTLVTPVSQLLTRLAKEPEGHRIFIGPSDLRLTNYNDTFLYHLLPALQPSSYYLEMNPGSANRNGSPLAHGVEAADVIVLTSRYDAWNEPNASREVGDDRSNRLIARAFCEEARFGPFEILRRCGS